MMTTFEMLQPWVVYHYGRTHDDWWPFWTSTRVLGRCCIVCECAVCGDVTPIWLRIPRFGSVPDQGHHPARVRYLKSHTHPGRGAPMSWAKPLLNPAALPDGIDLDQLAMRMEADMLGGEPSDD